MVFEPTASTPPISSTITTDQREVLREYYSNCIETGETDTLYPLEFALVLSGGKPAVVMHPSSGGFPDDPFNPADGLRRLCDTFGLSYRQYSSWWFVARTTARLDLLPTDGRGRRTAQCARRFGVILGYPPSAVNAFVDSEGTLPDPMEHLREQHTTDAIADVSFLSYRMDDPEKALDRGRRVRTRLEHLAETWDVPELAELVKVFRQNKLDELRVEI